MKTVSIVEQLAVITTLLFCSFIGAAHGEEASDSKFGAWNLHCEKAPDSATGRCALTQTIRSEDTAGVGLAVIIRKSTETKNGMFQVVAPLSVLLPEGVTFKIDETDIGGTAFIRCFSAGCLAQVPISDELLEKLKTGKVGVLTIYVNPYEGLRHLLMLQGFKEGYENLSQH